MHFGTVPAPSADDASRWLRPWYQAGATLFVVTPADRLPALTKLLAAARHLARCPLMWRPSFAEFTRWSRLRRRLKLQVWRRNGGCEVHGEGEFSASGWSIEIWRGDHRASLPMNRPELHVPDDGLVYQQAPRRPVSEFTLPHEAEGTADHSLPEEKQHLAA